ncbi:MAG: hypothetical protein EOM23_12355 [Candidatus Moranbacteria bacterium]|nr:hypothetical protein [Candidatus Moranbacteria bacterium]
MRNGFAVFILSHGRPDSAYTYETLIDQRYTGKVYFIVDDTDKTLGEYREHFGEMVLTFSKSEIKEKTDTGDNFKEMNIVLYARNACWEIARQLGLKYFLVLDDDYIDFRYKFDNLSRYISSLKIIYNLDSVFTSMVMALIETKFDCIAMAQNGDYIGGADNGFEHSQGRRRKIMNTFFCVTKKPFKFFGRINEDVNAYVFWGRSGKRFLTVPQLAVQQKQTQSNPGGLTDSYLTLGTYVKSFYSVMYAPSCVHVKLMQSNHPRIHHQVKWNCAVPKILREEHRKQRHE